MISFSVGLLCGALAGFMTACLFAGSRIKELEQRLGDQDRRLDTLNSILTELEDKWLTITKN